MINLDNMTLPELLEVQKRLPTLIAQRQAEVRRDLLDKVSTLATKHGLTLDDLMRKGRKRHAAKYMNPDDQTQTWTGVGSRPKWIRAWIEEGRDVEDLKIKGATT